MRIGQHLSDSYPGSESCWGRSVKNVAKEVSQGAGNVAWPAGARPLSLHHLVLQNKIQSTQFNVIKEHFLERATNFSGYPRAGSIGRLIAIITNQGFMIQQKQQ